MIYLYPSFVLLCTCIFYYSVGTYTKKEHTKKHRSPQKLQVYAQPHFLFYRNVSFFPIKQGWANYLTCMSNPGHVHMDRITQISSMCNLVFISP